MSRRSCVVCCLIVLTILFLRVLRTPGKNYDEKLQGNDETKETKREKKVRYFTTSASKIAIRQLGFQYERKLPKVLGIGVKKCGTTALFRFLSLHEKVVLPSKPELHFFDTDEFFKGPEHYKHFMPFTSPSEWAVEKSPRYFVLKNVPPRVKSMIPDVKVLLVVCDPVRRAYSDFNFESHRNSKHLLKIQKSDPFYSSFDHFIGVISKMISHKRKRSRKYFEDFVLDSWSPNAYYLTILNTGLYSIYLKNWLKYFPMDQIHVVNGDELITHPVKVIREAQQFLGIDIKVDERDIVFDEQKGYHCIRKYRRDDLIQCMGDAKGTTRNKTTSEMMSDETLKILRNFYEYYNEELFRILEKRFEWT